jgi:hypothetical protein
VASDYSLKFELVGFGVVTREGLVASYGHRHRDRHHDAGSDAAEQLTVVGQTPVIDTKKTQSASTSQRNDHAPADGPRRLGHAPAVPGMLLDRENVGGSDSGQQSSYFGHGSQSGDSAGASTGPMSPTTRPSAGPGYFNMSGYDEVVVNYGNNDVTTQTGGVKVNFITRRAERLLRDVLCRRLQKGLQAETFGRLQEYNPRYVGAHQKSLNLRLQLRRPAHQGQAVVLRLLRDPDPARFGITGAKTTPGSNRATPGWTPSSSRTPDQPVLMSTTTS